MPYDIGEDLRLLKIDVHAHVFPGYTEEIIEAKLAHMRRVGITELWCSAPIADGRIAPMEEIKHYNDAVIEAMRMFPDAIRGMCFIIPSYFKEALVEVERCLDAGMIGIKLYNQYKIWDPAVWPVLQLAAERHIPVLEHAGHSNVELKTQPLISDGADIARASQIFPEAILINAHIGGGGDLEWTLRAMRDASPQSFVDISGSNLDSGQVEMAIAELGVERVLFATDGTVEGSVGKVVGPGLSKLEKELVCWKNAARILAAQGLKPLSGVMAAKWEVGEAS